MHLISQAPIRSMGTQQMLEIRITAVDDKWPVVCQGRLTKLVVDTIRHLLYMDKVQGKKKKNQSYLQNSLAMLDVGSNVNAVT